MRRNVGADAGCFAEAAGNGAARGGRVGEFAGFDRDLSGAVEGIAKMM